MKTPVVVMYLATVLFFAACSSVQVSYDYDQEADFTTVQTYAWREVQVENDALAKNPLIKKRVMDAVNRYMAARGYRMEPAAPDVFLAIHAGVQEKMRVTNWGGYYRDPWYDPWWGPGYYGGRTDVSYYTEGTLVIDVVDAAEKELIWRGLGRKILQEYRDQEKMQAAIDSYVAEILGHFPPGFDKDGQP